MLVGCLSLSNSEQFKNMQSSFHNAVQSASGWIYTPRMDIYMYYVYTNGLDL